MRKEIRKCLYFRRRFIGLGFMYHHNSTPIITEEAIYVIEFKFLFIGGWITINYYNK